MSVGFESILLLSSKSPPFLIRPVLIWPNILAMTHPSHQIPFVLRHGSVCVQRRLVAKARCNEASSLVVSGFLIVGVR